MSSYSNAVPSFPSVTAAPRTRLFLLPQATLGWEGKERFSNEALAHLRYVRALGSRLHGEAFGQVNYDQSRRLDFRSLVGSGIRLALIAGGESSFWLGSSLDVRARAK